MKSKRKIESGGFFAVTAITAIQNYSHFIHFEGKRFPIGRYKYEKFK